MEHVRTVTREFTTGVRAALDVEARSGAVSVEGYEGDAVLIEAVLHVWTDVASDADEDASLVARSMTQDGAKVSIRAPALSQSGGGWSLLHFGRGSRVDYRIRVPATSDVRVDARSGRVSVARVTGHVDCEMRSGKCTVEEIRGDVAMRSRSGSVSIDGVEGALTAEARSGRVKVRRVRGRVSVEARSGSIDIADAGGDLRASARSGAISIEDAGGAVNVRSRCGPVRYRGAVKGDFDIEVQTGPIMLSVDTRHPFFIDAEAHLGPVRSELSPRRGAGQPSGDGPKVRLRTHTGPITIARGD